jgi:hypothetical protein
VRRTSNFYLSSLPTFLFPSAHEPVLLCKTIFELWCITVKQYKKMSSQADVSTMNRSIHEVTPVALSPASSGRLLIIPCDGTVHLSKNTLPEHISNVFIGTWADRCSSSKGTVVQELMYLIADQEGQRKVIFYLDGLGTRSSWLGKMLRGKSPQRNSHSRISLTPPRCNRTRACAQCDIRLQ